LLVQDGIVYFPFNIAAVDDNVDERKGDGRLGDIRADDELADTDRGAVHLTYLSSVACF